MGGTVTVVKIGRYFTFIFVWVLYTVYMTLLQTWFWVRTLWNLGSLICMPFLPAQLGFYSRMLFIAFATWTPLLFIAHQQLDEFGSICLFSWFLNQVHLIVFGSTYIMLLVLNMGALRAKSMQWLHWWRTPSASQLITGVLLDIGVPHDKILSIEWSPEDPFAPNV